MILHSPTMAFSTGFFGIAQSRNQLFSRDLTVALVLAPAHKMYISGIILPNSDCDFSAKEALRMALIMSEVLLLQSSDLQRIEPDSEKVAGGST